VTDRAQQLHLMSLFRRDMAVIEPTREWPKGANHPSFKRDETTFKYEHSTFLFGVWCAGRVSQEKDNGV